MVLPNVVKAKSKRASAKDLARIPAFKRHLPRILLPLHEMIDVYVASENLQNNRRITAFFDFVKGNFSDSDYETIQENHLSRDNIQAITKLGNVSPEQKYLDFPFWAHSKLNVGLSLGLENRAGESILDIGSGPGHFGLVARYFGCAYEGLELPLKVPTSYTTDHLYNDLCAYFGVERITMAVRPNSPLQLSKRFDVITCLMGNFCAVSLTKDSRRPWNCSEWSFFLQNLITDVMKPRYLMYFNVNRVYVADDVATMFRKFAKAFDEERSVVTFDETLDIAGLQKFAEA